MGKSEKSTLFLRDLSTSIEKSKLNNKENYKSFYETDTTKSIKSM